MTLRQFGVLGVALLTIASVGELTAVAAPVNSSSAPASSGSWVPVARVNPTKPVRITILNRTGSPLDYIVTTQTDSRRLAPGETAELSGIALPAYLNINAIQQLTPVRYQVSTKGNTAIVEVYPTDNDWNSSLNIDNTGAIYTY
jgi:hypothetical protein